MTFEQKPVVSALKECGIALKKWNKEFNRWKEGLLMDDWRLKTGPKPPLDRQAEKEFRLELGKEVIQVGGFKLDRFIKMMNMYVRMTLAQSTMHDCNDVLVLTTWVIMPRKYNTWKLLPHFYIYHL